MTRLAGKSAFVTGAASGLGRAHPRRSAAEGARVAADQLAHAGGGAAILCNSTHPVSAARRVVEKMTAAPKAREEPRRALAAQVPLGRLAEADEVAALALYLASDEARFVTGGEFVIDGGITAR